MSLSSSPIAVSSLILSPSQMVVAADKDVETLVVSSSKLAPQAAASSTIEVLRAFGRLIGIMVSGSVVATAATTESYKALN